MAPWVGWHPEWDGMSGGIASWYGTLDGMVSCVGWDPGWVGIPGSMASWDGFEIHVGWHPEWVDTLSGWHPKLVGSPGGMATRVGWHLKVDGTSRVVWHPGRDDIPS